MARLRLNPERDRSLLRRHPWLFESAIGRLEGHARPGDTVEVVAHDGTPLGRAAYSPKSSIRAKMWSFDAQEIIDDAFFKRRVAMAVGRRELLPDLRDRQCLRLINAESDNLPGIIADRYADTVVLQLSSAGADKWRKAIVNALVIATGCARIFERSDSDVRALEGLEPVTGWLYGEAPSEPVNVIENGIRYQVDIIGGHKTGFYLDQSDNRLLLRTLVEDKQVLNCFCYTGGFTSQALAGDASSVHSIDSSGPALALAQHNLSLNPDLPAGRTEWQEADVFQTLRELRTGGRSYDVIVLDPPKLAPTAAHAKRAARAYKDVNLSALRLLNPGGLLMTFSCSGGIGIELFQKIVAGAALDADRDARIVRRLSGSADHPVGMAFPEGEYLKGLLLQVD